MNKKERSIQIQESIRGVLMQKWDPIGIKDEPGAQEEYDRYIEGVYRLLADASPTEGIVDYLYKIETERIGLSSNRKGLHAVAEMLKEINVKL